MISLPGERAYRRLFAAYVLALVGTGVAVVGLTLLAFDLAGDEGGRVVATALAIKSVAYIVAAPVAAAATGRLHKRPFLASLGLVRAVALLALPFATTPLGVYLAVFVFTAASAAFTATYQALVPHLLPDPEDYARAVAKSRVAMELENGVSPLLAGAILLVASQYGLFFTAMAAFLLSAAFVLGADLPDPPPAPRGRLFGMILLGPRMLAGPDLRWVLALHCVAAAGSAMVLVNTVVLTQGAFGLGPRASVAALAVFGVAAALGAVAMPSLVERFGERRVTLAGSALVVGGLFGGVVLGSFAAMLALWAAIGAGAALAVTPTPLILRRAIPARRHPAAYAALFAASNAALVVGYLIAGWVGDADVAHRGGFVALGLIAALAAAWAAAGMRSAPAGTREG